VLQELQVELKVEPKVEPKESVAYRQPRGRLLAQDLRQLANLSPAGAAAPKITWVDGMMRMESIRLITQQSGRSTEPPVEVWSAVTSAICTGTTPVMTQALYLLSILLQQRLDRTPLSSEAKGALLPKGFAAVSDRYWQLQLQFEDTIQARAPPERMTLARALALTAACSMLGRPAALFGDDRHPLDGSRAAARRASDQHALAA
jgi:hypothetical protein